MRILTIESSCDETSAAVIDNGKTILSNAVATQIPIHNIYGGVVPELASRNHLLLIDQVIDEALRDAKTSLSEIEGFAATAGPGLIGSLLVGVETAKTLAYATQKPFVGLNHLEGHLTAILLDDPSNPDAPKPHFPYLGVIVSGGHTDLYIVNELGDYTLLGRTRDDAAGEAFDKTAKMLGLGYPGGQIIDKLAKDGDPEAIAFPRPMKSSHDADFSFSGLKTAVLHYVESNRDLDKQALSDLAASFQEAVCDVLTTKAERLAKKYGLTDIVYSGGVACNSRLRALAEEVAAASGHRALFAPAKLCTDNAAMLGPAAYHYLRDATPNLFDGWDVQATRSPKLGGERHRRHHR